MTTPKPLSRVVRDGILNDNPTLRMVLGCCPTLAITTAAVNGLGMGLATTAVLIGSNFAISVLRNVIPEKVRIPSYIVIISGFVTIIQYLLKAYVPALDKALGIYIPLIVANCIILARAEMFAAKFSPLPSILDGLGMGLGFTLALFSIGTIREIFGMGTFFGIPLTADLWPPASILILPPGGFLAFGIVITLMNRILKKKIPKASETAAETSNAAASNKEEA